MIPIGKVRHVTVTQREETWSTAAIKARLAKVGLTQNQLADETGLDRSVVNALINGRRKMSSYYAGLFAKPLKARATDLLPPTEQVQAAPTDPYVLLRRLAETVAAQQGTIDELLDRVASLERGEEKPPRAHEDGR